MAECPNVFQAVAARPPASHAAGLRSLWGTNHEPGHSRCLLATPVPKRPVERPAFIQIYAFMASTISN